MTRPTLNDLSPEDRQALKDELLKEVVEETREPLSLATIKNMTQSEVLARKSEIDAFMTSNPYGPTDEGEAA